MAQEEDLKKWKALGHICICFLPSGTVKELDILLNPMKPLLNDWRKVAESLGYLYPEIQHLGSLMKTHGSQFLNMLEDYKRRKSHSVQEFVHALYSTGRQDVKDAIKHVYEDVTTQYHKMKYQEVAQIHCIQDNVKTLQYPYHCSNYSQCDRDHVCANRTPHLCHDYPQSLCLHQQHICQPIVPTHQQQPMDIDMHPSSSPELPSDHSYHCPHAPDEENIHTGHTTPNDVCLKSSQPLESIEMKTFLKSENGLEHPPYTPVPNSVQGGLMLKNELELKPVEGYIKEEQMSQQIAVKREQMEPNFGVSPKYTEDRLHKAAGVVIKTEGFLEKPHKSTDSSDSTDSKRNTYPKYEKSDSMQSQLSSQLRSFQSTQGQLETPPYNTGSQAGIKEVFVTYPDDKPIMKYIFQLLDNLQKNNFKTSADQKEKEEKLPEKIYRRFQRSDFIIICISTKYKEQISPSSPLNFINQTERLHTADIYAMMQAEVEENGCNNRFIPVLLKGASMADVPTWLKRICPPEIFYQWPSQYKSLLFHLIQPKKLVERYQRCMKDMSKRSLQCPDLKSQPHKKQSKYHSSAY